MSSSTLVNLTSSTPENVSTTTVNLTSSRPESATIRTEYIPYELTVGVPTISVALLLVLLFMIGGCIYLASRKVTRRDRARLGDHTFSVFDIANVFDDDREPYATLTVPERSCLDQRHHLIISNRTTFPYYAEVTDENVDNEKHEDGGEELSSFKKPEPPRKCNTLSGILWNRLGVGCRRNDRATLDRYIHARGGSTFSSNDYVESHEDRRTSLIMWSRERSRSQEDFVPEEDNLWERCSRDGRYEHDVVLRSSPDGVYHSTGELDTRSSVMSDLLRSSWIGVSSETSHKRDIRTQSQLAAQEGLFIPEDGCVDESPALEQISQNLIDMISKKFQCRDSDSYKLDEDVSQPIKRINDVVPFDEKLFSEPNIKELSITENSNLKRLKSLKTDIGDAQEEDKTFNETIPRLPKRALPPLPIDRPVSDSLKVQESHSTDRKILDMSSSLFKSEKKGILNILSCSVESYRVNFAKPDIPTKQHQQPQQRNTSRTKQLLEPSSTLSTEPRIPHRDEEDDYENLPDIPRPLKLNLKPLPPPKHLKPKLILESDPGPETSERPPTPPPILTVPTLTGPPILTTPTLTCPPIQTKTNFLLVSQQLKQTLAMKLPVYVGQRRNPDNSDDEENM